MVSAIDALLEALNENNRALARWGAVEEREIESSAGHG